MNSVYCLIDEVGQSMIGVFTSLDAAETAQIAFYEEISDVDPLDSSSIVEVELNKILV